MTALDIELQSITKSYGTVPVVRDLSLSVPRGEFVSILGPSGCGKTTTLNMIAGFATPSSGDIRIRGKSQVRVSPEHRNIGLVFQNYALFPHMTVAENVGFGLKMRKVPKVEVAGRIAEALESVHLSGYAERYPRELSGGQQQRVALARAIAPRPSVLLLDEPLSNLDLKLREAMRIELKEIQAALGMTFVYVTHDQEEAMAMSDRIVVMWGGEIAQEGRPGEIYRNPKSRFVADFIGRSNLIPFSSWKASLHGTEVMLDYSGLTLISAKKKVTPETGFICIRPENLHLVTEAGALAGCVNRLSGRLRRIVDLGAQLELTVELAPGLSVALVLTSSQTDDLPELGAVLHMVVAPEDVQLLSH
ncbi:ABC transporter ATP-binding protein [Rhizobium sp. AQ_MP]|uniref:ABC transporter ATP-binding protein n=1 Tax=Rhizobium sp. AQ_MP TaxID=2761536 RepID=UPI00163B2443|nr:ABC transporter ATP-binding protein [Rhizobium sp. AQ_MP]MBC2774928.1 ABC transporter ATP-binding protein [Rhizobium sp. AQ_MP]